MQAKLTLDEGEVAVGPSRSEMKVKKWLLEVMVKAVLPLHAIDNGGPRSFCKAF